MARNRAEFAESVMRRINAFEQSDLHERYVGRSPRATDTVRESVVPRR